MSYLLAAVLLAQLPRAPFIADPAAPVPVLLTRDVREPATGAAAVATVGGVVYAEYQAIDHAALEVANALTSNDGATVLAAGTRLYGYALADARQRWCTHNEGVPAYCLVDDNADRALDAEVAFAGAAPRALKQGPVQAAELFVPYDAARFSGVRETWRRELVYAGMDGGAVRLLYRRWADDAMVESAEVTYTLDGGPTPVYYQHADILINSASNDRMQYIVVRGFGPQEAQ